MAPGSLWGQAGGLSCLSSSSVALSLLACLSSPVREVRRAAIAALQSLSEGAGSPFEPITARLLKNTEEIIADPAHVSQVRQMRMHRHRHTHTSSSVGFSLTAALSCVGPGSALGRVCSTARQGSPQECTGLHGAAAEGSPGPQLPLVHQHDPAADPGAGQRRGRVEEDTPEHFERPSV